MKGVVSVLRHVSPDLIGQSRLFIIDTEGGNRLSQFCAISSTGQMSQSECLNLYNLQTHRLGGKSNTANSRRNVYKQRKWYGNWLPYGTMLTSINQYFRRSDRCCILVGHSAINADSLVLSSNMLLHYQQHRQDDCSDHLGHSRIVGYIDTLPLFKRLYPDLPSYKQQDLVKYFLGVTTYNAHNALDDSLMLFSLWNKFIWPLAKDDFNLLSQASVSNLYCVDRFLTKNKSSFKDYFKNLNIFNSGWQKFSSSRKLTSKITLFRTKLLLRHLYPKLIKTV